MLLNVIRTSPQSKSICDEYKCSHRIDVLLIHAPLWRHSLLAHSGEGAALCRNCSEQLFVPSSSIILELVNKAKRLFFWFIQTSRAPCSLVHIFPASSHSIAIGELERLSPTLNSNNTNNPEKQAGLTLLRPTSTHQAHALITIHQFTPSPHQRPTKCPQ